MPILSIEIVTRPNEDFPPNLAAVLADRAGQIFNSEPGGTWVKVTVIASEHYAENLSPAGSFYPVFVSVLKAAIPAVSALRAEAAQLAAAVAQVCSRPQENVHILYLPEGTGRVAFGGELIF